MLTNPKNYKQHHYFICTSHRAPNLDPNILCRILLLQHTPVFRAWIQARQVCNDILWINSKIFFFFLVLTLVHSNGYVQTENLYSIFLIAFHPENHPSKLSELFTLKGLCHIISKHIICRTMPYLHVTQAIWYAHRVSTVVSKVSEGPGKHRVQVQPIRIVRRKSSH